MSTSRRLSLLVVLPVALLADCVLPHALGSGSQVPVVAVTASAPSTSASSVSASPLGPTPTTVAAAAPADLNQLTIKGRAARSDYDRGLFGQRWADVDRNGCDTRNDILRRDLSDAQIKPGTNGCKVTEGTLRDPYSGRTVALPEVQIDHVVALSDAWQKGAQGWTAEKRLAFANDPANLQATLGSMNQAKRDSDAATWLPPNKGYRCQYVRRQIAVKVGYDLWVTQAEHDAFARVLASCDGRTTPSGSSAPAMTTTTSSTTTTASSTPAVGGQCDPAYPGVCISPVAVTGDLDCSDIPDRRFVVLSPDPHNFDGNHDGVGCEGD